jgi:hypothetical protein
MKILSIGKTIQHPRLDITSIELSSLQHHTIEEYNYIIINGGDGTIRRVIKQLQHSHTLPPCILNPTGSFNVIAKLHRVPPLNKLLEALTNGETLQTKKQRFYTLNSETFLFSAGNMGDMQHIFLAETLRFGLLKHGMLKYILSILFLLPLHLAMTPFMLLSKRKFFIFTPLGFIKKFGSFYGEVKEMKIDLDNNYNHIELDGDIVTIEDSILKIKPAGFMEIAVL